ncbi:MAG: anti-sigma factor [Sporocytophaga sp.]|uniref:anti-sigma factor n=1 Tax=Sporocytophaga sp. TaxID=2231183 RepID=UPI001AFD3FF7|nr:anti-sigma factor [Sporocytophaga sp.]MBO9698592.1 anti-sigma factor [Sporocytophaga sp.]
MTSQELINSGKLELYVLGELSEAEAHEIEIASAGNPDVNEEIRTLQNALRKYVMCFEKTPPLGYKRQVLEDLARQNEVRESEETSKKVVNEKAEKFEMLEEKSKTSNILLPIFIVTSLISLIAAVFFAYRMQNANNDLVNLNSDNSLVKESSLKEKETLLNEMVTVKSELQSALLSLEVLKDSNFTKIELISPDGTFKVPLYWNRSNGDIFVDGANMHAVREDKTFQLWTVNEGIPDNSGTVIPQVKYLQKMKGAMNAEAFSLTIESKGDVTDPSFENIYATITLE